MREQERRRRSPDPAATVKGKSKKKVEGDDGDDDNEEEAEPILQSDGSSPTPPPAKRPRKGKDPAKVLTTPTKSKAPGWKAATPMIGASKSKRTRTRSRATINVPIPPAEPVLHQVPAIDPQLEEYDAVVQAGYPRMELQHDDYSLPATVTDPMQAVSGWEPEPDLDALARAYIQDHE
jgi:hypothetical protein